MEYRLGSTIDLDVLAIELGADHARLGRSVAQAGN